MHSLPFARLHDLLLDSLLFIVSKYQLETKLTRPRPGPFAVYCTERRAGHRSIWRQELRVIQRVGRFSTKLEPHSFLDLGVLQQRQITIVLAVAREFR